jgi:phosphoadenosine phosphosulfate reductase
MAKAARSRDVIDVSPSFTQADADALTERFADVDTQTMLATVLRERLAGEVAVVSSFGTESAVLLDMVAKADPATPVLLVDTLKLFPETLAYRDLLVERLGLSDVRAVRPDPETLKARDATELRWSYDPDGCCEIRKVIPLRNALLPFDAWITGRKAFQAKSRNAMPRFEVEDGRLKINPLANWTKADLDAHFAAHDLPRHPLEAEGYLSIGCMPCTSIVQAGEDPRAGRWRGWDKVECGIHGSDGDGSELPVF